MEQTPMTRERLFALRETIARLENENVPGLLKAARKGAATGFERKIGVDDAGVSSAMSSKTSSSGKSSISMVRSVASARNSSGRWL